MKMVKVNPNHLDLGGGPVQYEYVYVLPPLRSDSGYAMVGSNTEGTLTGSSLVIEETLGDLLGFITDDTTKKKVLLEYL